MVTVEYFLDKMQPYEVSTILDYIDIADKTTWEQTRMQMYITAQVNSTKKLKPTDIIPFTWDKEKKLNNDTSISNADIDRLTKLSKMISDKNITKE